MKIGPLTIEELEEEREFVIAHIVQLEARLEEIVDEIGAISERIRISDSPKN